MQITRCVALCNAMGRWGRRMNLLINEPPLQVLPSLALKVGLNGAIFLQQLHFRLLISTNERDGYKWIYKTYPEWQEEFPFWSYDTVKRIVADLEKGGYIITTSKYNKIKMDKTKWYRVIYSKLGYLAIGENAPSNRAHCIDGTEQNAPTDEGKMHPAIPKDIKSIKNINVEGLDDVSEILNYLNKTAHKNFRASSTATQRIVKARLKEGYTVEDFKRVIDIKTQQWLNNPDMNKYLQPNTLFAASKFEGYLNENQTPRQVPTKQSNLTGPLNLNFNEGEDI